VKLISGKLAEAKEGCARLGDTDADTFIRVFEYLYTGDYQAKEPTEPEPEDNTATTTSEQGVGQEEPLKDYIGEEENIGDVEESLSTAKSKKSKKRVLVHDRSTSTGMYNEPGEYSGQDLVGEPRNIWNLDRQLLYPSDGKNPRLWELFEQRPLQGSNKYYTVRENSGSNESWKNVFRCHAQVYAFADKYDIAMLRNLALYKLRQTLVVFRLYEERVDDVVELLSYTYEHTAHRDRSIDDLRLLVVQYATCMLEVLAASSRFRTMLEAPGPFAKDLLDSTLWRLD
jgi:hypothetical protein